MTIKIIEQNTKEEIGQIKLSYIPSLKEYVEFENHNYFIHNIIHSESEVKLQVLKADFESDLIIVEPDVY